MPCFPFSNTPFLKNGEKLSKAARVIGPPYAKGHAGCVLHVSIKLLKYSSNCFLRDWATDSVLAKSWRDGNGIEAT